MIAHKLMKFIFVNSFSYEVSTLMSGYEIMSLHFDKVTIIVYLCICLVHRSISGVFGWLSWSSRSVEPLRRGVSIEMWIDISRSGHRLVARRQDAC